jgi:hypothetical protein
MLPRSSALLAAACMMTSSVKDTPGGSKQQIEAPGQHSHSLQWLTPPLCRGPSCMAGVLAWH